MRVAFDTNRYIDFCKAEAKAIQVIQTSERIFLAFIVIAELRAGFRCGSRGEENERTLVQFLNSSRVEILYADEQTTHHYARLFFQLRKQGTPIPTNDLWLAALAVQHDLILFARDQHFDHLPQIPQIKGA